MRVLVVEDDPDLAEATALTLRFLGFAAEIARDGRSAVQMASASPPDAVLIDIGLPDMDGFEAARQLRPHLRASARVVAVTGRVDPSYAHRSREAGFDAHLIKPVEPEELTRALAG